MAKVCPSCELTYSDEDFFCAADGSPLRAVGADADNLVGTVIADRYRVESIIGEGGMGRVYRARHVRVPREAAIKVLRRALIADAYAVASFNREARNAASVGDHPNVAAVYDFGETADGLVFLAMEYIDGETLAKRLEREPVLSPRRAVEIIRQIAAGLTAAHELPESVVHRDLKPDNILLKATRDGTDWVKVVDFGIAKAVKRDTQLLTTPGLVVGTPKYMSPEQLTGGNVDVRSDIYALGMMAFQMLTGRMPFASSSKEDESSIQWALQRLTLQPLTLAQVRPDIQWPSGAQAVIDRALATAAADRTPTATEFARALGRAFGLATPSGAVGVVAEVPGPVSGAVRAAAQSTAPTAPLAAAELVTSAGAAPAPPGGARGASSVTTTGGGRSRTMAGAVGGLVVVAALAGLLWKYWSGADGSTSQNGSNAGATVEPNDASRGNQTAASASNSDSVAARQPTSASDSAKARPDPQPALPTGEKTPGAPSKGTETDRSNPTSDPLTAVRARSALDRAKDRLKDVQSVSANDAEVVLRDMRRLLPQLTARADSVEATYYLIEANLQLDRPEQACRLIRQVRRPSRGTEFEANIERYAISPELNCANR
jgi:serine/threonine-protein kinase